MEEKILQSLGFTFAEARVYLILLKIGSSKVGKVIEKSGLQSSTIHNTLHSLTYKGFVKHILKGKTKIYQSLTPELILESYKEKEKLFEKIIPQLKQMQQTNEEIQQAEIYSGINGITMMLNELIKESKPKDDYYFFAVDVSGLNKEIQDFFEKYDLKRKERKLNVKGLARKELKKFFENRHYLKTRYTHFPIPTNISICNNKMVLINWEDEPKGIMIASKQIVKSQIDFFNEIWNKASES